MSKLKRIAKTSVIVVATVASTLLLTKAASEYKVYRSISLAESVKNATVQLRVCPYKTQCSGGTGFVYKETDHGSFIISNKHVCEAATLHPQHKKQYGEGVYTMAFVEVVKRGGTKAPGQIIRMSDNADLCLIFTQTKFKNILPIATSYKIGEQVASYGFPAGQPTLLKGTIKDIKPFWLGIYAESDMKAWYGISGAAVVNKSGEVVGVMSNLLTNARTEKEQKDRSKVYGSLFIPLEILQEFIGGN